MRLILILVLTFVAHAAHADLAQHAAHATQSPDSLFFKILRHTQAFEFAKDATEMVESSEVIVRGAIVEVQEGRHLIRIKNGSTQAKLALFKFEVVAVLKGDVGQYVYFEYPIGGADISILDEHKSTNEMLIFLRLPGWRMDTLSDVNGIQDNGLVIYELNQHSGLIVEFPKGPETPLDMNAEPIFLGTTLAQIETQVAAALSEGVPHALEGLNMPSVKK